MATVGTRHDTPEQTDTPTVVCRAGLLDALLLVAVPLVLVAVWRLPESHDALIFHTAEPTVLAAYTTHFVHLDDWHLLGNLAVYAVVASATYLCCLLSGRRRLFRWTFVTVLLAFPFALTGMQLAFPDGRAVFGFSGINAAFVGVLCFALVGYLHRNISRRVTERDAPALVFVLLGLVAFVSLPGRAWRAELVALTVGLGGLYLLAELARNGLPTREGLNAAANSPGHFEFAGAVTGLLLAYPFVGFGETTLSNGATLDLYLHLLGLCLGFLVVYVSVLLLDGYSTDWERPRARKT